MSRLNAGAERDGKKKVGKTTMTNLLESLDKVLNQCDRLLLEVAGEKVSTTVVLERGQK